MQASLQQDKKYRILLADDNFDMREYLGRLLSEKYEVVTVCDGTATQHDQHTTPHDTRAADIEELCDKLRETGLEALRMVEYMDIDLVLTDVMMPRLDGLGLLKELRYAHAIHAGTARARIDMRIKWCVSCVCRVCMCVCAGCGTRRRRYR